MYKLEFQNLALNRKQLCRKKLSVWIICVTYDPLSSQDRPSTLYCLAIGTTSRLKRLLTRDILYALVLLVTRILVVYRFAIHPMLYDALASNNLKLYAPQRCRPLVTVKRTMPLETWLLALHTSSVLASARKRLKSLMHSHVSKILRWMRWLLRMLNMRRRWHYCAYGLVMYALSTCACCAVTPIVTCNRFSTIHAKMIATSNRVFPTRANMLPTPSWSLRVCASRLTEANLHAAVWSVLIARVATWLASYVNAMAL